MKSSAQLSLTVAALAALISACDVTAQTRGTSSTASALLPSNTSQATGGKPKRIVLLLPIEQTTLRRAALAVRDGVRAASAKSGDAVELRECAYGDGAVIAAYQRCVVADIDAVIGPLGRNEVVALSNAHAKLPVVKPTLMLSPLEGVPPTDFFVLAPDLESEAEAIAERSLQDACRRPLLLEMQGPLFSRIANAISRHYKSGGVSTALPRQELGARELWQRGAENWRRNGIDCVLFAGSGSMIGEIKPYLRGATIYIASSSYEAPLDAIADWNGVRIADSPFVLDPARAEFANIALADNTSPTLMRLMALGVDAARIVLASVSSLDPNSDEAILALRDPREGRGDGSEPQFKAIERFEGAIGDLELRKGQYVRKPAIGEFRGRVPSLVGQ